MNRKLTEKDLMKMEKLVKEGTPITHIAKAFKINRKTVYLYINERGWRKKQGFLSKFFRRRK